MGCSPVVRTTTQHSTQHTASTTPVTTTSVNTTPEWWMAFLDWAVGCSMVSWRNFGDVAVWIIRHRNKIFWYLKIRERGGLHFCNLYCVVKRAKSWNLWWNGFFLPFFSKSVQPLYRGGKNHWHWRPWKSSLWRNRGWHHFFLHGPSGYLLPICNRQVKLFLQNFRMIIT